VEKLNSVAKLTEEYLKNYCSNLETKRENNKYLFFCGNYLIGSTLNENFYYAYNWIKL